MAYNSILTANTSSLREGEKHQPIETPRILLESVHPENYLERKGRMVLQDVVIRRSDFMEKDVNK